MKIRSDFLTNSSSSSFIAYGVSIDRITLSNDFYLMVFNGMASKAWKSDLLEKSDFMTEDSKINYVKEVIENHGLDYVMYGVNSLVCIGGYEQDCVGISPLVIMRSYPDEPMKNMNKLVAQEINSTFGTNFTESDIDYFEEIWFDG